MAAHIGTSPLTGRIYQGRLNKAGNAFVAGKVDVTSGVLRAVIEKAEFHGGTFEIEGGGSKWTVTVRKQPAAQPPSDAEHRAAFAAIYTALQPASPDRSTWPAEIARLRAAAQPPAAMPGWQWVPVEPTQEMREAPAKDRPGFSPYVAREIWAAMLAAAPAAQPVQPSMLGALKAVTAQCNRLKAALELACSHLTDEQAAEVAAAIPPKDGSAQPVPATGAQPDRTTMIQRLKDAIEGECDGLAIDDSHAAAVLDYVMTGEDPTAPAKPSGGANG